MEIRPATAADFEAYYGQPPQHTMRALLAVKDGEPIVFAGLMRDENRWVLFSDMRDGARRHGKTLLTMGRRLMTMARGAPVVAVADPEVPAAERFLARLGFRHMKGDLWAA